MAAEEDASNVLEAFTENDFFLDMADVHVGEEIGTGHFSTVYVARYFGDLVAVKKQIRESAELETYLLRELSVLKYISHPNMLQYIGAQNVIGQEESELYIVTEFARGGDFLQLLVDGSVDLSWAWRTHMLRDAVDALVYLHSRSLIHRDIKGANLLLDVDEDGKWVCKISDFGMTRPVPEDEERLRLTICGTDDYMAPELLFDEEYGVSADVFSLGMVLLEAIARKPVGQDSGFAGRYPGNNFQLDMDAVRPALPEDAPPSLVECAAQCLVYEPSDRITAKDALEWIEALIDEQYGGADAAVASPPAPPLPADILAPPPPPSAAPEPGSPSPPPPPPVTASPAKRQELLPRHSLPTVSSIPGAFHVVKMGYLFKRNRHGFRNWKKRWFVLTHQELLWYTKPEDAEPRGTVPLLNCTLVHTKQHRWQILDTSDMSRTADTRLHNRELAASDEPTMQEWMDALQRVIDNLEAAAVLPQDARQLLHTPGEAPEDEVSRLALQARQAAHKATITKLAEDYDRADDLAAKALAAAQRAGEAAAAAGERASDGGGGEGAWAGSMSSMRIFRPVAGSTGVTVYSSVEEWLAANNLSQLTDKFYACDLVNMRHLEEVGLAGEDLDMLGVEGEDRALLEAAARASGLGDAWAPKVRVRCDGWKSFGDATVYHVHAACGFSRSAQYLRYEDFGGFHQQLRHALRRIEVEEPKLPGKGIKLLQRQQDSAFINNRRAQLMAYLGEVIELAERKGGEPLNLLLSFLRLAEGAAALGEAKHERRSSARSEAGVKTVEYRL